MGRHNGVQTKTKRSSLSPVVVRVENGKRRFLFNNGKEPPFKRAALTLFSLSAGRCLYTVCNSISTNASSNQKQDFLVLPFATIFQPDQDHPIGRRRCRQMPCTDQHKNRLHDQNQFFDNCGRIRQGLDCCCCCWGSCIFGVHFTLLQRRFLYSVRDVYQKVL